MTQSDDLARSVRKLLDIEEIKLVTARYLRYLDSNQWEQLRSVFTANATVSFEPPHPTFDGVDEFIEDMKAHLAGRRITHHGHMPEIVVHAPDRAFGMWALHLIAEGPPAPRTSQSAAGPEGIGPRYYEFDYEREDGQWRISNFSLRAVWVDGVAKPFERIEDLSS